MSEKTRVLYITFNGIADPLGQSQILPYLEDLSKSNIQFYLISLEKNLKKAGELSKHIQNLGIRWYRLKYFKHHPLFMVLNAFQCFLVACYIIASKKVTIVHCRSYLPLFSVLLPKKIFHFKLIFDMRGFWPEELADSKRITYGSASYKILKFLEKKSILSSDDIVTLTPEAKEILESNYTGKKVVWMPTCVDQRRFEGKEPVYINNKFVMVYSGSLWTFYNMPSMIDFFNVLKLKISNAHFLILGNNETEKLHNLFNKKGLTPQDYTILTVKSGEVPQYLLGSNLGISFIYDYYSKKAAFPTKLAEYLICGLPVIANVQSDFMKNLIRHNNIGVILEKFDNDSYQKAVENLLILLKDDDLKKRCIQTAQKYLDKSICVNKYLDIYKGLE